MHAKGFRDARRDVFFPSTNKGVHSGGTPIGWSVRVVDACVADVLSSPAVGQGKGGDASFFYGSIEFVCFHGQGRVIV